MSVLVSMGTVSPSLYCVSGQKLNINKVSTEILMLGKKKKGTTNVSCSTDHKQILIPKNLSSGLNLSAKNEKISGKIEKESVLLNGQLSSKMHDGLDIVEFFSGKKLLITGATGFLAKGTLHYYIKRAIILLFGTCLLF